MPLETKQIINSNKVIKLSNKVCKIIKWSNKLWTYLYKSIECKYNYDNLNDKLLNYLINYVKGIMSF